MEKGKQFKSTIPGHGGSDGRIVRIKRLSGLEEGAASEHLSNAWVDLKHPDRAKADGGQFSYHSDDHARLHAGLSDQADKFAFDGDEEAHDAAQGVLSKMSRAYKGSP